MNPKSSEISPCSSLGNLVSDRKRTFLIGVAGGTASGKSTVCERIMDEVHRHSEVEMRQIKALSQDSFYRELSDDELKVASKGLYNFDHPDAFDFELMTNCLRSISEGKKTKIPIYDFKTNSRMKNEFKEVDPSDVVLVEGILVFYNAEVRGLFDMKLFVDTDADTRLARRVLRDTEERGRDLETILTQYTSMVKPAFEEFCLPTKKFADVIIPRGAENTVAIKLIGEHIRDILAKEPGVSRSTNHRILLTSSLSEPIGYDTRRKRHLSDLDFSQMRPH